MEKIKRLLLENRAWAHGHVGIDPDYFANLAKEQSPDILWIGCSDSRVPPDQIINTSPGSLFVHRNIANVVHSDDQSLMTVLEFAVKYLKVKYIIVCGHYNCGGVRAAFEGIDNPRLSHWTRGVRELKFSHAATDVNQLVELSVHRQIENLSQLPAVKEAWESGQELKLIGWVYDLHTGLIQQLTSSSEHASVQE